ncbi:MAG: MBL fold metallo-hydrolase [Pseudonocardia sp.]|uniref:MBL fold metallo-hydrolase n=1 Tax=Pseudonocardia sp. TaxID=60912 RepID=UPI001AD479E8|nr:MBL fold metallo-hydrolase [Pseudonocardia sp.]MBN9099418.1 MBL fold metallo-hydrolase [Pseudonocardia sp.]
MILDDDPDGDWTAPGVFRCAPGVHRIPLPLPNDGLRAVNVYAVEDGDGITLVDSGWALSEARDLLETALKTLGAGFGDVRRFLVTHSHRDHYTQAVVLRHEFGMRVALGRGERSGLDIILSDRADGSANQRRLARAGAHELLSRLGAGPPPVDPTHWAPPDEWIDDGDEIVVGVGEGLRRLRAVATPGHTRGHVVFADEAADLLFSGDHVLPRITPSIALEPDPPANPLADFLTSLELMRSRPDAAMLPAHGPVGMRVHERVDELIAHHGVRLDASLAAVREGRSTASEVAAVLPWTRRGTALVDLDPFNAMLATLETASHLEVLVQRDVLTRSEQDGVDHYSL